jgi:rod shape-determining protein MreC
MLSRETRGRALPTLITLIVLGILLMTFDVRSQGEGVVGVLRTGVQTIIAPIQRAASLAVNPVVDLVESLSNVANLREENIALRRQLADAEAALVAVQDQIARLELLERILELEEAGNKIGRTVANVIGRPDAFDQALTIDKGTNHGIVVGQPVIDENGYVVGTIKHVTAASATVVPITADRQGLTVVVDDQTGTLVSQVGTDAMRLEVIPARSPVLATTQVTTSALSSNYPAGLPVGEVMVDAAPTADVLVTTVRPYVNPETLRLIVVLAWPPDPASVIADDTEPEQLNTTTTSTSPGSTTTTGGG